MFPNDSAVQLAQLDQLVPTRPAAPLLRPVWATVVSASPLLIQLPEDSEPVPVSPKSLTHGLMVGDVVWCVYQARDLIVVERLRQDQVSTNYGTLSGTDGTSSGGYEMRANGLLRCWVRCGIQSNSGQFSFRLWTFPVPFITLPAVSVTASTTVTAVQNAQVGEESLTSAKIGMVRSTDQATYVMAQALGFWRAIP